MKKVFIYWDNSNIFIEAQFLADKLNHDFYARYRVRLHFENLLLLAHANRPVEKAYAVGSIPPEMDRVWTRLRNQGVKVPPPYDRGKATGGEQQVPDILLQREMVNDVLDYEPATVVLLTGDGAGYEKGEGFHATLERMHKKEWKIELLSWENSTSNQMRKWVEEHGVFIPLDDFYDSITFLEPSKPGYPLELPRNAAPPDLSKRKIT